MTDIIHNLALRTDNIRLSADRQAPTSLVCSSWRQANTTNKNIYTVYSLKYIIQRATTKVAILFLLREFYRRPVNHNLRRALHYGRSRITNGNNCISIEIFGLCNHSLGGNAARVD